MVFEDAHWIDPTSRELLDLTDALPLNLPEPETGFPRLRSI